MRSLWFLAPLLVLAGCGGGGDAGNNTAAPEGAPVASASPPAGQQWTDVVEKTADGGYRMGNPNAPIKLVEYGSRTCPACRAFDEAGYQPLTTQYVASGRVSYEFRDFLIHGAPDMAASLLGRCAGPAPFFPILDGMYQNQDQFLDRQRNLPPQLDQQLQGASPAQVATVLAEQLGYLEFIKQRGVPEAQARQCLNDQTAITQLSDMYRKAANELQVQGTPTFFLNGTKLDVGPSWPEVEAALKRAGAR